MKQEERPRTHFIPEYLANPMHPITVDLVGCGGNGSIMMSCLASINKALLSLGKQGLAVTAYDDDEVSEANLGRQLFSAPDLGSNKARVLVTRFNRVFGTAWKAVPEKYKYNSKTNIIISCTDNVKSRKDIARNFKKKGDPYSHDEDKNYYWLDLGNSQSKGQAVLGSREIHQPTSEKFTTIERLPSVTDLFPLSTRNDKESGPSCSLAEALAKQDLFINRSVATMAADVLWQLLRKGHIENHGFFLNLETFLMAPIAV